jgi:ATP-dependent protease Clp ATPase subunit
MDSAELRVPTPTKPFEMRCSLCGRLHTDVAKLIAGQGIYICDGCVNLCVDILAETTHAEPPSLPGWATLSDNELLQRIPFIASAFTNCATAACHRQESARHWA